jgi:hypothetical protein
MLVPIKPLVSRSNMSVWLEELRRWCRRNTILDSPDIRATHSDQGSTLFITSRGGSSNVQQYLLIDASEDDYLICRAFAVTIDKTDPENPKFVSRIGITDVLIAKPYELRRTPFDREVLNADDPGAIGTTDENTVDVIVEAWVDPNLTTATRSLSYEFKSATYRIASNVTDPDNPTTENQTIIPRFIPAVLSTPAKATGAQTLENAGASLILAKNCSGMAIEDADGNTITLLAESDGRAWSKTS